MSERLCLMTVHAHPDDESSKGAATVARYHAAGVHTVLVSCTGGEEGDVLNPALDTPDVRERLHEIRHEELERAAAIIGYDEIVRLGYRDSGMPDTPANLHPESFAAAPLDEAVGRLVAVVRRWRPQVLVTYPDDQSEYPHPDHLRAHEVSAAAFDAAGDPDRYPEAGPPFQPLKLYYTVWPAARLRAMHEALLARGLESPFTEKWLDRMAGDEPSTTTIDVSGFTGVTGNALRAHATQVDPGSSFWFGSGLPEEEMARLRGSEDYRLGRSRVGMAEGREDDLFARVHSASTAS